MNHLTEPYGEYMFDIDLGNGWEYRLAADSIEQALAEIEAEFFRVYGELPTAKEFDLTDYDIVEQVEFKDYEWPFDESGYDVVEPRGMR